MKKGLKSRFSRISNKKGSVMVIVLVVMTLLVALAAGVLHAANTERNIITEQVKQEQVYQMSVSANNFLLEYLDVYFSSITPETMMADTGAPGLVKKIPDLPVGGSVTFKTIYLRGNLTETNFPDEAIYKHDTQIKMKGIDDVSKPNTTLYYTDVITVGYYKTTEGEWCDDKTAITQQLVIEEYVEPDQEFTNEGRYFLSGFGSTGEPGAHNDPNNDKSEIKAEFNSSIYFGNQFAEFNPSKVSDFSSKMSTFGSIDINGGSSKYLDFSKTAPAELNVRNYFNTSGFSKQKMFIHGITMRIGGYYFSPNYIYAGNGKAKYGGEGKYYEGGKPTVIYALGRTVSTAMDENGSNITTPQYSGANQVSFGVGAVEFKRSGQGTVAIFANGNVVSGKNNESMNFINGHFYINGGNHKGTYFISGNLYIDELAKNDDDKNAKRTFTDKGYPESGYQAKFFVGGDIYIRTESKSGNKYDNKSVSKTDETTLKKECQDIFLHANGVPYFDTAGKVTTPANQNIFPWGTREAWPVRLDEENYKKFQESIAIAEPRLIADYKSENGIASDADAVPGLRRSIRLEDFETIEQCFNRLNYETVELSYDSSGEPILDDNDNYILLSRPMIGNTVYKQTEMEADPDNKKQREVVIDVQENSDCIATMSYKFKDTGTTISKANEPKILSPKVFPVWDVAQILEDWIQTDTLLRTDPGESIEGRIDLTVGGPEITVAESGYIDTAITGGTTKNIIIDTTVGSVLDKPQTHKNIYIRLCDNQGGSKEFNWFTGNTSNSKVNVLVKGAGSVVFFMDDGVAYNVKSNHKVFIGHRGWYDALELDAGASISADDVAKYIHPAINCKIPSCLYCKGLDAEEKSPGAYLIRQDNGGDGKGRLINKYINENIYLHNNIFLVNKNDYGVASVGKKLTYLNNTIFFGYLYSSFSSLLSDSGDSNIVAGSILTSAFNQTKPVKVIDLKPANYYYELVNPAAPYSFPGNAYKYQLDITSTLLNDGTNGGVVVIPATSSSIKVATTGYK